MICCGLSGGAWLAEPSLPHGKVCCFFCCQETGASLGGPPQQPMAACCSEALGVHRKGWRRAFECPLSILNLSQPMCANSRNLCQPRAQDSESIEQKSSNYYLPKEFLKSFKILTLCLQYYTNEYIKIIYSPAWQPGLLPGWSEPVSVFCFNCSSAWLMKLGF